MSLPPGARKNLCGRHAAVLHRPAALNPNDPTATPKGTNPFCLAAKNSKVPIPPRIAYTPAPARDDFDNPPPRKPNITTSHHVDNSARPVLRQEEDGHRRRPVQGPSLLLPPDSRKKIVDMGLGEMEDGGKCIMAWGKYGQVLTVITGW